MGGILFGNREVNIREKILCFSEIRFNEIDPLNPPERGINPLL
jgi:hypothetical protein